MKTTLLIYLLTLSYVFSGQSSENKLFYVKPNISTHGTFGCSFGIQNKFIEFDLGINSIYFINRIGIQTILKKQIKQFKIGLGINAAWIVFRNGTFYPYDVYWSDYLRVGPVIEMGYTIRTIENLTIIGLYSPAKFAYRSTNYVGNGLTYDELISLGFQVRF